MNGFVYAVERPDGLVKIGFSRNPNRRFTELRKNHVGIVVLGALAGTDRDELAFHRKFSSHRVSGEWFEKSTDIRGFIGSLHPVPPSDLNVGRAIKNWRRATGLTLRVAAKRFNISTAMLSRVENGINLVKAERVLEIERITGISRHDLRPDLYPRDEAAA